MVLFEIDGIQPKQRPRHLKNGHTYTPKETRDYELAVATKYALELGYEFKGAVKVTMVFEICKPKSAKRIFPSVRPDLDNLAKSVMDGLNGMAWHDDGQVCELNLRKRYSYRDKVWVRIEELKEWDIDDL